MSAALASSLNPSTFGAGVTLSVGTHTFTASYSSTPSFAASTSPPLSQIVNPSSVLYVDRNSSTCTNTGTGTAAAPFCMINFASQKATAGKTISVAGAFCDPASSREHRDQA